MNRFLDSLARLSIGALADIGLACVVLGVFAGIVWPAASAPLLAGAAVAWLLAAAAFTARRMAGRSEGERRVAASALAAFALLVALFAAASAGRATGIVPSSRQGSAASATQAVAGATATAGASSPAEAAASTEAPSPESTALPSGPLGDASPTPHQGPVQIDSLTITSPVARGGTATVTVATTPWTPCSIRVSYRGASGTPGLEPTVSDGSGAASWTWTIGPGARSGTWPVRVTCKNGGYSAWDTVTLRVQ